MASGGRGGAIRRTVGRWREWFLLDGHRGAVTAATAVAVFLALVAASVSKLAPLRDVQPLLYVFGGLVSGNLTVVTVVVAINQLLLSRELSTPGQLQTQIEGVIDYREGVEDAAGQVAPAEPRGFLRLLMETMRKDAQQLGGMARGEADEEVYHEIDRVVSTLTDHADQVDSLLVGPDVSTFNALSTTLTTNYAREIKHLREIQTHHGDRLPPRVDEAMGELLQILQEIDVARQYFKTIYLEEELAALSRLLFYVGLPSLVTTVVAVMLFTAETGVSVPRPYFRIVVPAAITVGLLPLTVLFAFIVRTATVTRRTVATVPFTTPDQEQ